MSKTICRQRNDKGEQTMIQELAICENCGSPKYECYLVWNEALYYFCSIKCLTEFANNELKKENV